MKNQLGVMAVVACLIPAVALANSAAEVDGVTITDVRVDKVGYALVTVTGGSWNQQSMDCSGNSHTVFEFDVRTDSGKAMLSSIMAAKLAGRTMHIYGTGSCLYYPVEDINIAIMH